MRSRRRTWTTGIAAVAALAAAALVPGCSAWRAGRVFRDALGPPEALASDVVEREERAPRGPESLRVRLTLPAREDGPWPAILLVHGAAQGGPDDPRMVGLARALAAHGFAAASLDLPGLAAFRIDGEDPARIAAAAAWLADRRELAADGRVALAGISVGGSYSLLAADDPALAGRLTAVLAFGAYADLEALLLGWMTTSSRGTAELLDPHTEGRRLVLLGNVGRLVPADEERVVAAALRALAAGGATPAAPEGLSGASRRVLRAAASEDPLTPDDARALLAPFADDARRLSPSRATSPLRAPVFLLHAEGDPVVPSADAETLGAALRARGAETDVDVSVHVTDLFGHVEARGGGAPSFFEAWPLLRFVGRFLDAAGE
jgi:dienelactone hydrolase